MQDTSCLVRLHMADAGGCRGLARCYVLVGKEADMHNTRIRDWPEEDRLALLDLLLRLTRQQELEAGGSQDCEAPGEPSEEAQGSELPVRRQG